MKLMLIVVCLALVANEEYTLAALLALFVIAV